MPTIVYTDKIEVRLVSSAATDLDVVQAARVSVYGADALDDGEAPGLINFLMANRHGTPFEHNYFKFLVTAPLFVWREHHRHRIGFSYNEESGRYRQLEPKFYVPSPDRPLKQVGKAGAYEFVHDEENLHALVNAWMLAQAQTSYHAYTDMLEKGVAKEVARMCLPVNIMSSCFVTMNARSLMSFLSLRTKDEDSKFPSYPQYEIELVARQYEEAFAEAMPLTYEAWVKNGRVAP